MGYIVRIRRSIKAEFWNVSNYSVGIVRKAFRRSWKIPSVHSSLQKMDKVSKDQMEEGNFFYLHFNRRKR